MRIASGARSIAIVAPLFLVSRLAAGAADDAESRREQLLTVAAEAVTSMPAVSATDGVPVSLGGGGPLFTGIDDGGAASYRIDVSNGDATPAFTGFEVWGAAYDVVGNRVLFNSGATLYQWALGGVPAFLGTITDGAGNPLAMAGLAWYGGALYGARDVANEGIYVIDATSLVATVAIDSADDEYDFGGISFDHATGELYAVNDDATPHGRGLFRLRPDGTAVLVAPYPAGETDLDGLAICVGFAFLVPDEPGQIHVWDLGAGAWTTPLPSPWTTTATHAAGAWIFAGAGGSLFADGFESGDTSRWPLASPANASLSGCGSPGSQLTSG